MWVLIFAICNDRFLLRRKTHPAPQAGKWNGLGGKVCDDDYADQTADRDTKAGYFDLPYYTAIREFAEEAGVDLPGQRLTNMATLHLPLGELHIFHADLTDAEAQRVDTTPDNTGEYNRWFTVDDVNDLANEDRVAMDEAGIAVNDDSEWAVAHTVALIDLVRSLTGEWASMDRSGPPYDPAYRKPTT